MGERVPSSPRPECRHEVDLSRDRIAWQVASQEAPAVCSASLSENQTCGSQSCTNAMEWCSFLDFSFILVDPRPGSFPRWTGKG